MEVDSGSHVQATSSCGFWDLNAEGEASNDCLMVVRAFEPWHPSGAAPPGTRIPDFSVINHAVSRQRRKSLPFYNLQRDRRLLIWKHVGEGAYDETERMIKQLLAEETKPSDPKPNSVKMEKTAMTAKVVKTGEEWRKGTFA